MIINLSKTSETNNSHRQDLKVLKFAVGMLVPFHFAILIEKSIFICWKYFAARCFQLHDVKILVTTKIP